VSYFLTLRQIYCFWKKTRKRFQHRSCYDRWNLARWYNIFITCPITVYCYCVAHLRLTGIEDLEAFPCNERHRTPYNIYNISLFIHTPLHVSPWFVKTQACTHSARRITEIYDFLEGERHSNVHPLSSQISQRLKPFPPHMTPIRSVYERLQSAETSRTIVGPRENILTEQV